MTKAVEKVKKVIKDNIENAVCGIFNCRNSTGDLMEVIYDEAGVRIEICRDWKYFEVFGLAPEEFAEVASFYEDLILKMQEEEEITNEKV